MNRIWKRMGWIVLGVAVSLMIITQQPLQAQMTAAHTNWCVWNLSDHR